MIDEFEIKPEHLIELLGSDYPRDPWLKENDHIGQFMSIINTTGYTFKTNCSGGIDVDVYGWCNAIIKNHMRVNGKQIVDRLSDACQSVNGKISYFNMTNILGFKFSRADCVSESNMKYCTILFLKEMKLPFKYDDTYIYLP